MARKIIPARERFEKKVRQDADGCWYWTGCRNQNGYPQMRADGEAQWAHRLAFELYIGPIPPGKSVMHTCDHGPAACVNPAHLRLGTQADNLEDMARKGRGTKSAQGLPFGVAWHPERVRKFSAEVRFRRKRYYLGAFFTMESAALAAQEMKRKLHGLAHSPAT